MCAGLGILAVIWGILALALNGLWATGLVIGGFMALVAGVALQESLRGRRRSAWIASGGAVHSLEVLEVGFGRLAREIEDQILRPVAPIQRGATLPQQTFEGGLKALATSAEEIAKAVNRLDRCFAGTPSTQRTQALLSELRTGVALALAELAKLQALRVRPEDEEGHRLLIATFTGVLRQIGDWASFGKDRVRAACGALVDDRSAELELPLALVAPPELHSLRTWLNYRGWCSETPSMPPTPSAASLSTALLAGLLAGSMLGGHGPSEGPGDGC